jgi:hypothetical protein
MDRSSPSPVNPADLYDGPDPMANVTSLTDRGGLTWMAPPDVSSDKRLRPDYVATITVALDVLGARILALIAVIAACGIWSFAVYDPTQMRTYAAIGFSLTVLIPTVALYWRRG